MGRALISSITVGALITSAWAQLRHTIPPTETFRADAKLVLLPVTVVDRRGSIVNGLPREAFTVLEDHMPQQIASFAEQDVPVSIGVVFDMSGSMKSTFGGARVALRSFFETANPEDDAFLYTVSTQPKKLSGYTQGAESLLGPLVFAKAQGSTALVDTIYASLNETRRASHAQKALLIISDGMDNHSRYSKDELTALALESDAQIYAISIYNPHPSQKPIESHEEQRGLRLLAELAERTGGLHFVVRDDADIHRATADIGQALRNQYVIGDVPQISDRSGKWRSIQIKLNRRDAKAYTRSGYRSD